MSEPRETLEERLANRRQPGDPDFDAFYDATDAILAAMVPPRAPIWAGLPDLTDQDYRRMNIRQAATMMGCPYYRGEGKCASGCYAEPSCITDRPFEAGWEGVLIEAEREEPGSVRAAMEEDR